MAEEGRLQMCGFFTFDREIKVSAFGTQEFDKAAAWLPMDISVHLSCK